jgi:hypothetical protein
MRLSTRFSFSEPYPRHTAIHPVIRLIEVKNICPWLVRVHLPICAETAFFKAHPPANVALTASDLMQHGDRRRAAPTAFDLLLAPRIKPRSISHPT